MSSIAETRYSQRLSANGNCLFDNVPTYKWETASEKLSYFYFQYKQSTFDFDPPHQRNESLHSIKWESDIVNSVIRGLPLGFPEFDTVLTPSGVSIRRSLDGKQRCMAILRFMDDKYRYCLDQPSSMKGKKFSELTPQQKNYINNRLFNYTFTDSQLSDEIVSEWFCKKQVMQKTSQGEKMNSLSKVSALVKFIHKYNNLNNIANLFTSDKRHKALETTSRIVYAIYAFTKGNKIDPKYETIMNYAKSKTTLSDRLKEHFSIYMDTFYHLLSECESNQKYSKSFMLPLLNLFLEVNNNENIDNTLVSMFIKKCINKKDKYYNDVAGNHDATKNRCIYLSQQFKEFIESNK